MPSEEISQLLVLQERDRELIRAEDRLNSFPADEARIHAEIGEVERRLEDARALVREAELAAKEKDRLAGEARAKIDRLRNQQLQVKKNEEYQALEREIAELLRAIDTHETEELEAFDLVDERKAGAARVAEEVAREKRLLEGRLEELDKARREAESMIDDLREGVRRAEKAVPPSLLENYENLKKRFKRLPVAVALVGQQCQGCHLRVSNEIADKALDLQTLTCDQCGRLLYVE